MATHITGLIRHPNGELLEGDLELAPLTWFPSGTYLVTNRRIRSSIAEGVVDASVETLAGTVWSISVTSIDGTVSWTMRVDLPVSGAVDLTEMIEASTGGAVAGTVKGSVPAGGSTGQMLVKKSPTNYDTEWVSGSGGGGATNLDGLSDVVAPSPSNGQVLKYNGTNWVPSTDATATPELPTGGTTGQVLAKKTNTTGDVEWVSSASGGGSWGSITGSLSGQTDLWTALQAKASTTYVDSEDAALQGEIDAAETRITALEAAGGGADITKWYSVKGYGAVGNGSTDDTAAIQAAVDAVPSTGGILYFPPGRYRVTAPITMKSYVHIVGCEPAARYWTYSSSLMPSACAIEVADSFSGAAVLVYAASQAYSIRNISIIGRNVGTVHGVSTAASTGETNALFENVAVVNMGGSGFSGGLLAARFRGVYVGGCKQWGMIATTKWTDVHVSDSYVAGNASGGISLAGTQTSGYVTVVQTRFERSGFNSATPTTPSNAAAPGLYITRLVDSKFIGVETDGNTGHGLHIVSANTGYVYNLDFVACTFRRDGPGTFASLGEFAGVRLEATGGAELSHVAFLNCVVADAKADDSQAYPAYTHPKYGVWMDHTTYLRWNGGRVDSNTTDWYAGGAALSATNYRPQIDMQYALVKTNPAGSTASRPTGTWAGQSYFDTTLGKPVWWNGSAWVEAAAGTTDWGRWSGTQAQYDALGTYDANTLYVVTG